MQSFVFTISFRLVHSHYDVSRLNCVIVTAHRATVPAHLAIATAHRTTATAHRAVVTARTSLDSTVGHFITKVCNYVPLSKLIQINTNNN